MSEGRIKVMEMMYQARVPIADMRTLMQILAKELNCLDCYERRGTFLEKNCRNAYERNTHKFRYTMYHVNNQLEKYGVQPIFRDIDDFDTSVEDYYNYVVPHYNND